MEMADGGGGPRDGGQFEREEEVGRDGITLWLESRYRGGGTIYHYLVDVKVNAGLCSRYGWGVYAYQSLCRHILDT